MIDGTAMPAPSIAVVIPTHNRPMELRRALRSVYRQSLAPAEVVVVDDCSQPPLDDDLFADKPSGLQCRLMRNPRPMGAQAARNRGLRSVDADYVALLDDDDEFHPEKIRILAAAATGGAQVIYHAAQMVFDDEQYSYVSMPAANITLEALLLKNLIGGTSMVCLHRQSFLGIGGFDEAMPALQDYEAWLRCAKHGLRFERSDEVLTVYHHVSSTGSISKSLAKVDQALGRIDELYATDYARLTAAQLRQRRVRVTLTRAHRMLMNDQRWKAARYCLHSALRLRSARLALGSLSALAGLKTSLWIKRAFGQ